MTNGSPAFWVRAEYAFMQNVLETADQLGGPEQKRLALLQAAEKQIRERGIPDEPHARAAVTAERETALSIISRALNLPTSTDPLGRALDVVSQKARDWAERNP